MVTPGLLGHQSYCMRCLLPPRPLLASNCLLTGEVWGIRPAVSQSLDVQRPPLGPTEVFGELSSSLGTRL